MRTRLLMLVAVTLLAVVAASGASADPVTGTDENGTYLALGDSVSFGYVPSQAVPAPNYHDQHSFVGWPDFVAQHLGERVSNAACPGETSLSLVVPGAQSNGCENGYRALYQLHVQYQGTQLAYALDYLAHHKHTQLVTIMIGANDFFLCQATTADHCSSLAELVAVATQIATQLGTVLQQVRGTGYDGPIVTLTYYSLNYTDPAAVAGALFLNSAVTGVTLASGGIIADGFAAFQGPSTPFAGSPCAAGLLIKLPNGSCDVHPTAAGQQLLAGAVLHAIGA
jgi:lysophospholipase L1-like esterase